jgi:hypothetical protein
VRSSEKPEISHVTTSPLQKPGGIYYNEMATVFRIYACGSTGDPVLYDLMYPIFRNECSVLLHKYFKTVSK